MAISWFINNWTKLKKASYLEVGIGDGHGLSSIKSKDRTGVDIQPHRVEKPNFAFFQTSSDLFFKQCSSEKKWDLIYIDADHSYKALIKDFNNSIKHLNKNGLLILHDTFPQEEILTKPEFCGDSYKILYTLINRTKQKVIDIYTSLDDYGVTIIKGAENCPQIKIEEVLESLSYSDFRKLVKDYKLYSIEEFKELIRSL